MRRSAALLALCCLALAACGGAEDPPSPTTAERARWRHDTEIVKQLFDGWQRPLEASERVLDRPRGGFDVRALRRASAPVGHFAEQARQAALRIEDPETSREVASVGYHWSEWARAATLLRPVRDVRHPTERELLAYKWVSYLLGNAIQGYRDAYDLSGGTWPTVFRD